MTPRRQVPRVVLNCMVVLEGAGWPGGPAAACLELAEAEEIDVCLSPEVLSELSDVLSRPRFQRRFPSPAAEWIGEFLQNLQALATFFEHVQPVVRFPRDPNDEPYLNLAVAADATFLVTWENRLLELMDSASSEATELRIHAPQLAILDPVTLLRSLAREPVDEQ